MENATTTMPEVDMITMGDNIRAMSDDELAWLLQEFRVDAYAKAKGDQPALPDTKEGICNWLKERVVVW